MVMVMVKCHFQNFVNYMQNIPKCYILHFVYKIVFHKIQWEEIGGVSCYFFLFFFTFHYYIGFLRLNRYILW